MKFGREQLLLYAVTDRAWTGAQTLYAQAESALRGGATCLQLREKDLDMDAFAAAAGQIRALCRRYGVPFIVNDSVEIALRCGADGIHVGQRDMPPDEVRARVGPDCIVGVSAQTVEQALRAERLGADYLGVGAVFSTSTKRDAAPVSRETLREICAAVSIPVCAIGGITLENAPALAGTGIAGLAVVSALFAAPDVAAAARALRCAAEKIVNEKG